VKITKADREALRRELTVKGYSVDDIALVMMARYGARPRLASRWAHGMTLGDVAEAWNQQDVSGRAPMTSSRVSDYERWPDGGRRPTVYVLLRLAKIFDTTVGQLLDQRDYARLNDAQIFEIIEVCRANAGQASGKELQNTEPTTVKIASPIALSECGVPGDDRSFLPHRHPKEIITFPSPSGHALTENAAGEMVEMLELARRAEVSELSTGTLESLDRAIDQFCRDYPVMPPMELLPKVRQRLEYVSALLGRKSTLNEHRHLLVAGGWLSILLGCLQFDIGAREAAEACRDAAYRLGRQAGHQEIMAWSFELLAWSALVDEKFGDAVEYARAGQELASNTFAGAQLAMQEAKAWARCAAPREASKAMARAAARLERLPVPAHPEHHLVMEHALLRGLISERLHTSEATWIEPAISDRRSWHQVVFARAC